MPLSLNDAQLQAVTDVARALVPPNMRRRYLERVAELLDGRALCVDTAQSTFIQT